MILLSHLFERVVATAFYPEGMIRLNVLDEKDFEEVPVLRQVLCLCRFIHDENGRLKLTPKGNLPLKVVKEMYEAGIRDWYFEEYPRQRIQEDEARFVRMARDLATKAGIVRKRNNALVMTRKGDELLLDKQALLETLIRVYVHLFNADDYDGSLFPASRQFAYYSSTRDGLGKPFDPEAYEIPRDALRFRTVINANV